MLIGFKARFAPKVESGEKTQTIRARGKRRPPRVGEKLQLYTGLRTQYARKLRQDAECIRVTPISISPAQRLVSMPTGEGQSARWQTLDVEAIEQLARADGFESAAGFFDFFEQAGGSFSGYLIEWRP